jgi:hypothetical protein
LDIPKSLLQKLYFDEGLTQAEIARRLGCGQAVICRSMQEYGLMARTIGDYLAIDIPRDELIKLYVEQGLSADAIADRFNCSGQTVLSKLKKHGIPVRPPITPERRHVPDEVLAIWTPELAYAVGLIASDGNLPKGKISVVCMVSTDPDLIELYRTCLRLSETVSTAHRLFKGKRKPVYVVTICDRAYRAFLEDIGLTPAKSKTLGPLAIPDHVFRDFLRGCWDGDECWTIQRQQSREYLHAVLVSGSLTFLLWVQATVQRLIGLYGGISGISLTYAAGNATRLGQWLYYAPNVLALSRKRAIWERFAQPCY